MSGFWRDIADTYRTPGRVITRKLAAGVSEAQMLGWLMGALLISFIARAPIAIDIARQSAIKAPLQAMIGGMFAAMLIFAPLAMYALAALSHLIARMMGGHGSGHDARAALFWVILALQPVVIASLYGSILLGAGAFSSILNLIATGWFLWIWLGALIAVEQA